MPYFKDIQLVNGFCYQLKVSSVGFFILCFCCLKSENRKNNLKSKYKYLDTVVLKYSETKMFINKLFQNFPKIFL